MGRSWRTRAASSTELSRTSWSREETLHEEMAPVVRIVGSKAFFFNYLVYGSADPIFQDFEEKKKVKFF